MAGILPGATHADRLELLSDAERLQTEVIAHGDDPQERFDAVLLDAMRVARARFGGDITYAAGAWETVDWSEFDIVGIDAYRDAENRPGYVDWLRSFAEHGHPVVVTEFGCATYRGAGDRGGMAWTAVDRSEEPNRLAEGIIRDEATQAAEIDDQLDAIEAAGVDGAFLYTYFAPATRPARTRPSTSTWPRTRSSAAGPMAARSRSSRTTRSRRGTRRHGSWPPDDSGAAMLAPGGGQPPAAGRLARPAPSNHHRPIFVRGMDKVAGVALASGPSRLCQLSGQSRGATEEAPPPVMVRPEFPAKATHAQTRAHNAASSCARSTTSARSAVRTSPASPA